MSNVFNLLREGTRMHQNTYLARKQLKEQRERKKAEWETEQDVRRLAGAMFAAGASPCFRIEDLSNEMKSWIESNYTCDQQFESNITRCCLKQPIKQ